MNGCLSNIRMNLIILLELVALVPAFPIKCIFANQVLHHQVVP